MSNPKWNTWEWVVSRAEPVYVCFDDGTSGVYRGGYLWLINRDSASAIVVFHPGDSAESLKRNTENFPPISCAEEIPNWHVWMNDFRDA